MNLSQYLNKAIDRLIKDIIKVSILKPQSIKFLLTFSNAHKKAQKIRKDYEKQGQHIPPFLIASITSKCNLFCSGCYSRANGSCSENKNITQLKAEKWEEIFNEAKDLGISFILLAGGEPFMRKDVIEKATQIPEIIFPVFTNGTMFNDEYIKIFDKNRNLIPIISIEGDIEKTDCRRGKGVYNIVIDTMKRLKKEGVMFGVSVTVLNENLNDVLNKEFIDNLYKSGCAIIFYIEYVPVDASTRELALSEEQRNFLNEKAEALRENTDMLLISFPGDEKQMGGCLASGRGFLHINADGSAEPCPFSPFSDLSLANSTLKEAINSPFLKKLRSDEFLLAEHTGGCLLFEKEKEVRTLLNKD